MKHLALSWTHGVVKELRKFHFVFHVALKDVQASQSIENIIVEQHKGLRVSNVRPEEIKAIIGGHTNQKVLIFLDGYDEYHHGINTDIGRAITKDHLRNCWMIVTSRETMELTQIREYMDVEANIIGFDKKHVEEYISRYLGSNRRRRSLTDIVQKHGVIKRTSSGTIWPFRNIDYGILCIPILLHMICFLYVNDVSFSNSCTGILSAIVDRCIDWETIRRTGQRRIRLVRNSLLKLGHLAMRGLLQKPLQQTFQKVS